MVWFQFDLKIETDQNREELVHKWADGFQFDLKIETDQNLKNHLASSQDAVGAGFNST
jgi:hypothetical protein